MSRLDKFEDILNEYEGRKYEEEERLYKNLYLIVDSSGSITPDVYEEIKKGGKKAIAQIPEDGKCAVLNFSHNIMFAGWLGKNNSALTAELDNYQGGGSSLDANMLYELKDADAYVDGGIAVLMVTDGMISSFNGVSELFQELSDKGYFMGFVSLADKLDEKDKTGYKAIYTPTKDRIAEAMEDFAKYAFTREDE